MDRHQRRLKEALEDADAKLVRHKKHMVYELGNGRMVTVSSTPSDVNSSKKAYFDVRHAAAIPASKETVPNISAPEGATTQPKARFRAPVRDQEFREDPGIIIPDLGSASVQPSGAPPSKLQFESVSELVSVADEVDSFWSLTSDGRTRVLMKLAEHFAEVDVIGTRSYKTSYRGFEWFLFKCDRRDPLLALEAFDWRMPISRSICITTPDGQVQIIETTAKKVLEGTDQIAVILVNGSETLEERVDIESIGDEPEAELQKYVFHHCISAPKMGARNLHFTASKEWLDPQVTRPVISNMLGVLAERRKQ